MNASLVKKKLMSRALGALLSFGASSPLVER